MVVPPAPNPSPDPSPDPPGAVQERAAVAGQVHPDGHGRQDRQRNEEGDRPEDQVHDPPVQVHEPKPIGPRSAGVARAPRKFAADAGSGPPRGADGDVIHYHRAPDMSRPIAPTPDPLRAPAAPVATRGR